jgi:hypothetical protein
MLTNCGGERPMRVNFERYVDQITQNVIALLNILENLGAK